MKPVKASRCEALHNAGARQCRCVFLMGHTSSHECTHGATWTDVMEQPSGLMTTKVEGT